MQLAVPGYASVARISTPETAREVQAAGSFGTIMGVHVTFRQGGDAGLPFSSIRLVDVTNGLYAVIESRGIAWLRVEGTSINRVPPGQIKALIDSAEVLKLLALLD